MCVCVCEWQREREIERAETRFAKERWWNGVKLRFGLPWLAWASCPQHRTPMHSLTSLASQAFKATAEGKPKRPVCGEPRWERGWWWRHGTSRDVASRRVGNATASVILRLLRAEASVRQRVTVAATHFHSFTLPLSWVFTVSYRHSKLMSLKIPPPTPHSMVSCNYHADYPN